MRLLCYHFDASRKRKGSGPRRSYIEPKEKKKKDSACFVGGKTGALHGKKGSASTGTSRCRHRVARQKGKTEENQSRLEIPDILWCSRAKEGGREGESAARCGFRFPSCHAVKRGKKENKKKTGG